MALSQQERINYLIGQLRRVNDDHGTSVRCPVCNAGIGKFCLKPGYTVHKTAEDIALHPERVALARQS